MRRVHTSFESFGNLALESRPHHGRFAVLDGGLLAEEPNQASSGSHRGHVRSERSYPAARGFAFAITASVIIIVSALCSFAFDLSNEARIAKTFNQVQTQSVFVKKGDTLSSLASEHAVHGLSTQEVANWIKQENHMQTSDLAVGQKIYVPKQRM